MGMLEIISIMLLLRIVGIEVSITTRIEYSVNIIYVLERSSVKTVIKLLTLINKRTYDLNDSEFQTNRISLNNYTTDEGALYVDFAKKKSVFFINN